MHVCIHMRMSMCFSSPSIPNPRTLTSCARGQRFVVIKIHFCFFDHGAAALKEMVSVTVVNQKWIWDPFPWGTYFSNSLTNSGNISYMDFRLSAAHLEVFENLSSKETNIKENKLRVCTKIYFWWFTFWFFCLGYALWQKTFSDGTKGTTLKKSWHHQKWIYHLYPRKRMERQ